MHMCITSLQRAGPVIPAPSSALAPLAALGIPRLLRGLAFVVLVAEPHQHGVYIPIEGMVSVGPLVDAPSPTRSHVLASPPGPSLAFGPELRPIGG